MPTLWAALFAYHVNLMNSIPTSGNKFVPMSLLSRDSLEMLLNKVAIAQTRALDRLTLVIPFQEMLFHYEVQLLQDVLNPPNGLIMMSIPLASKRTVLTTYQVIILPMPQPGDFHDIRWE